MNGTPEGDPSERQEQARPAKRLSEFAAWLWKIIVEQAGKIVGGLILVLLFGAVDPGGVSTMLLTRFNPESLEPKLGVGDFECQNALLKFKVSSQNKNLAFIDDIKIERKNEFSDDYVSIGLEQKLSQDVHEVQAKGFTGVRNFEYMPITEGNKFCFFGELLSNGEENSVKCEFRVTVKYRKESSDNKKGDPVFCKIPKS